LVVYPLVKTVFVLKGMAMRRMTRVAAQVRDFVGHRLAIMRSGGSPEPYVDLVAQRTVLAGLVQVGILVEEDWALSAVPLSCRGATLDAYGPVIERRIRDRIRLLADKLKPVDDLILLSYAPVIAGLTVEMALLCFYRERMLSGVLAASRRRPRTSGRRISDPVDLVDRSAMHADPDAFLQDAQARLRQAKEDIVKVKRRILYLRKVEKEKPDADAILPRKVLPPVSMDTPAVLNLISAIRGATDDLLRPVTPVPLPDPAQRRR
jgi:hypothetical protein